MKKILVMFIVLAVVAPGVWAQKGQNLFPETVSRKIQAAVKTDKGDVEAIFRQLDNIRRVVANADQNHASWNLQSMLFLYEAVVSEMAKDPQQVLSGGAFVAKDPATLKYVCEEINRPMKTGWGKSISVSSYILDNINVARESWTSSKEVDELYAFNKLLVENAGVPFPAMTSEELDAVENVFKDLEHVRSVLAASKKEEPLLSLQVFMSFYENFASQLAANKDIDARFVAKNPEIVKALAREIQKPMKVGWKKDTTIVMGTYIVDHLPQAYSTWFVSEPADELDTFNRDILLQAK